MQKSADRHSDRCTSRKKSTLRQIWKPVSILRSLPLCSPFSALEAASRVLFGARLKIPDPNPPAKAYPRDITVIVDFFSFTSFHTALPADGRMPHSPLVRFVFSIFSILSLSRVIRRLSYTMRHHICNHCWPAAKNRGIQRENRILQ